MSPWVLLVIHLASGNMEQIPMENGDLCRYTRNRLLDNDGTKRSGLIEDMEDQVGKDVESGRRFEQDFVRLWFKRSTACEIDAICEVRSGPVFPE